MAPSRAGAEEGLANQIRERQDWSFGAGAHGEESRTPQKNHARLFRFRAKQGIFGNNGEAMEEALPYLSWQYAPRSLLDGRKRAGRVMNSSVIRVSKIRVSKIRVSKIRVSKIRESEIQASIIEYLGKRGHFVWRQNTGAMGGEHKGRRWFVRFGIPGLSDILGIEKGTNGRFLAIEVKRPGNRATDAQASFLCRVQDMGGIAFVAWSLDDVIKRGL